MKPLLYTPLAKIKIILAVYPWSKATIPEELVEKNMWKAITDQILKKHETFNSISSFASSFFILSYNWSTRRLVK